MCRGYYTRSVIAAWDWDGKAWQQRWVFDSEDGTPGNQRYSGQGNHGIAVGDVDGDQRDEIIYGSCVIDDNGEGLYSTGLGHGDAMHFTDIDPQREGLEVFKANGDSASSAGIELRDAKTGEQLFGVASQGSKGVGRACAMDIDPRHLGLEMWGKGRGVDGLFNAQGEKISNVAPRTCNMGIWWDGDLLRELLDGVRITKWNHLENRESRLFDARDFGCVSNNGSKSNPCLCVDLDGDWREELIAATRDGSELRIFSTPHPTEHRFVTLMQDPIYRLSIAWQNVSYNQPAHPGFYLGEGMFEVDEESPTSLPYIVGADISWVQQAEDRGQKFSDEKGTRDILAILKDHGFNFVRLRVFHDPTVPTPKDRAYSKDGYCDLAHTIEMAQRVKQAGLGLLIDFHYSDSWADPGKQHTPAAWKDLTFDELEAATKEWTRQAILKLQEEGAEPELVQIGNEITPGMMVDRGGSVKDWGQLGRLLKAGIAGVKEVAPRTQVILHITESGSLEGATWWIDSALEQDVEFDILGLSCYRRWHGPPSGWESNINRLAVRYPQLSFLIVEMAQEVEETNRIMKELPKGRGLGTFIWEPTANNNGQALFDRQGQVIPEKMEPYERLKPQTDK